MSMLIPKTDKPYYVGLIGTAATGTNNVLYTVNSAADLTQFGAASGGTIVNAANILLRYGVPCIVVKIDGTGTAAATETNIVGTSNPNTGLELFRDVQATLGLEIRSIICPGFSTSAIVTKMNDIATALQIPAIADWIGTYAALVTARGTATGFGIKSRYLLPCFPQLLVGAVTEYLSTHVAGLLGRAYKTANYGIFPHLRTLLNITGITPVITTTGGTPNNQALHDLGVLSVANLNGAWQLFGNRNASYTNANKGLTTLAVGPIIEYEAKSILTPIAQALSSTLTASETTISHITHQLDSRIKQEISNGDLGIKSFVKHNPALSSVDSYVFDACLAPKGSFLNGTLTVTLI